MAKKKGGGGGGRKKKSVFGSLFSRNKSKKRRDRKKTAQPEKSDRSEDTEKEVEVRMDDENTTDDSQSQTGTNSSKQTTDSDSDNTKATSNESSKTTDYSATTTDDTTDASKQSLIQRLRGKVGRKRGTRKKGSSGDTESDTDTGTDGETSDDGDKRRARKPLHKTAKAGKNKAIPYNMATTFTIKVTIHEARLYTDDLLSPATRTTVGSNNMMTSTCRATNQPVWNEKQTFSIKSTVAELNELKVQFQIKSGLQKVRDPVFATFEMSLGQVYAQDQHCVAHQWLALNPTNSSAATDGNPGHLKVTVLVLATGEKAPKSSWVKKHDKRELLYESGAQSRKFALSVHLFELTDMPVLDWSKQHECVVQVDLGVRGDPSAQPCNTHTIKPDFGSIGQSFVMPINWPSISNGVTFRLYKVRTKATQNQANHKMDVLPKNAVALAEHTIRFSDISASGNDGFLPTFGPTHVALYGSKNQFTNSRKQTQAKTYHGRLLCSIECKPDMSTRTCETMSSALISAANPYRQRYAHILYSAFYSGTAISSHLSDESISFEVSIGAHGNAYCEALDRTNCITPAVAPMLSKYKKEDTPGYAMPWGSHKPCAEIPCSWEPNENRVQSANWILSLVRTLRESIEVVDVHVDEWSNWHLMDVMMVAVEDVVTELTDELQNEDSKSALRPDPSNGHTMPETNLDRELRAQRLRRLNQVREKIWPLLWSELVRLDREAINQMKQEIACNALIMERLAVDPQISVPPVHIIMMQGVIKRKEIARASVPALELYYAEKPSWRGRWCGQLRPVEFVWSDTSLAHTSDKAAPMPCLLHLRLWLGRMTDREKWSTGMCTGDSALDASSLKHYAECWVNEQIKPKSHNRPETPMYSTSGGENTDNRHALKRFRRGAEFEQFTNEAKTLQLPPPEEDSDWRIRAGWAFEQGSKWDAHSVHSVWTRNEAIRSGHSVTEIKQDELFEVREKELDTCLWKFLDVTDVRGEQLAVATAEFAPPAQQLLASDFDSTSIRSIGRIIGRKLAPLAPEGYKWATDQWELDRTFAADGWTYGGLPETLADTRMMETEERLHHRYRRRRWYCGMVSDKKSTAANDQWEYARNVSCSTHIVRRVEDRFRRRRFLRELQPPADFSLHTNVDLKYPMLTPDYNTRQTSTSDMESGKMLSRMAPRLFVEHSNINRYELRAYVFWARDLLPTSFSTVSSFVQVSFEDQVGCTLTVNDQTNPIFNETLVLKKITMAGTPERLALHPPHVLVRLINQRHHGAQEIIGRALVRPEAFVKRANKTIARGHNRLVWQSLTLGDKSDRGSLLCMFELLNVDAAIRTPIMPPKKPGFSHRYAVPEDLHPRFEKFDVFFFCLGVRNLKRKMLRTIKQPFVKLLAGEGSIQTEPLKNANKNANFEGRRNRLLVLEGVKMPVSLQLTAPITVYLHEQCSFGRRPVRGAFRISEIKQYQVTHSPQQLPPEVRDSMKEANDRLLALDNELQSQSQVPMGDGDSENEADNENDSAEGSLARPDFWTRFYASVNETKRCAGVRVSPFDQMLVCEEALEDDKKYGKFEDFAETWKFFAVRDGRNRDDGSDLTENVMGELKGRLFLFQRPHDKPDESLIGDVERLRPPGLLLGDNTGKLECTVRVYVVRCEGLQFRGGRTSPMDTYVRVNCGDVTIKRKEKHQVQKATNDPTFGIMVEVNVELPRDKILTVSIVKKRTLLLDQTIGSTTIDLENRVMTKHRATVGLPRRYYTSGVASWRDQCHPCKILADYCAAHGQMTPSIDDDELDPSVHINGDTHKLSDWEPKDETDEGHTLGKLGAPKQRLALGVLNRLNLVPEHVETRQLLRKKTEEQLGTVQMWVDIFPNEYGPVPPPVDITPRHPVRLQLRVVVWGVRDAVMTRQSLGQPTGDLYVKAFIAGEDRPQKTDVHYRITDGGASYNYRMLFDVEYDPWERSFIVQKQGSLMQRLLRRKQRKERVAPELVVQIWDNHKFSKDQYLGQMRMNLLQLETAQLDYNPMDNVVDNGGGETRPQACSRWCKMYCCCCFCTAKHHKAKRYYDEESVERSSFIEQKHTRGWWPCVAEQWTDEKSDTKVKKVVSPKLGSDEADEASKTAKSQDGPVDAAGDHTSAEMGGKRKLRKVVTGKIELQLDLLPLDHAKRDPVGKAQKRPNRDPYLAEPTRPTMDSFWLTSRIKALWHKTKWWWLIIAGAVLVAGLIVIAVIFSMPEIMAESGSGDSHSDS